MTQPVPHNDPDVALMERSLSSKGDEEFVSIPFDSNKDLVTLEPPSDAQVDKFQGPPARLLYPMILVPGVNIKKCT